MSCCSNSSLLEDPCRSSRQAQYDRFIPYRPHLDVDFAHQQLFLHEEEESPPATGWAGPEYNRRLSLALDEHSSKILPVSTPVNTTRAITRRRSSSPWLLELGEETFSNSPQRHPKRRLPSTPEMILDIPGLRDDFYCDLLDWGKNNCIALALNCSTWVWNATTTQCKKLKLQLPHLLSWHQEVFYVTSVAWNPSGTILAIGTSLGNIMLWDPVSMKMIASIRHKGRSHADCLAWHADKLCSGTRKGKVRVYDVRTTENVLTLSGHDRDVVNLQFTADGEMLASGGDDGIVNVWSMSSERVYRRIEAHQACAKALGWCPWRQSILASGGGSSDGHLRLWHVHTGEKLAEVDTKTQVCSLLWSDTYHELVTSHGSPTLENNDLVLWKARGLSLEKVTKISQHRRRPLHLALSPDGTTVASVGADETLCLWKFFPVDDRRSLSSDCDSPVQLGRSIR